MSALDVIYYKAKEFYRSFRKVVEDRENLILGVCVAFIVALFVFAFTTGANSQGSIGQLSAPGQSLMPEDSCAVMLVRDQEGRHGNDVASVWIDSVNSFDAERQCQNVYLAFEWSKIQWMSRFRNCVNNFRCHMDMVEPEVEIEAEQERDGALEIIAP